MSRGIIVISIVLLFSFSQGVHCQDEVSKKSQFIYKSLKAIKGKEKIYKRLTTNPPRNTKNMAARKISRKLNVEEWTVQKSDILTVSPETRGKMHIVLIHGGAYVAEAIKGHRILVERLALEHGFTVTYIDYPLAPEYTASTTIELVVQAYEELITRNPDDEFYLVGDSAGGGLTLAMLQSLRDRNIDRRPSKTVLLSPWLDISMQNPDMAAYVDKDVVLSIDGLKTTGKQYAGDLDLHNPILSPIKGDLNNLGELKLFVSNYEIFYPDCRLFEEKIKQTQGTSIDFAEKYGMMHDWILFPIPERDETIEEVVLFLSK